MELMTAEQTERIKKIVEQSNSFGLFLDEKAEEHHLLARKALKAALREKGKSVFQIPETPEEFKNKWAEILPDSGDNPIIHSTLIHIPKSRFQIKEISYEDNDDFFTFNIESENAPLEPDEVVFESKPAVIDAVFCLGEKGAAQNAFMTKISMPADEKIIFINKNDRTVAEKIYEIIGIINEQSLSDDKISSLLYASLLLERIKPYQQSKEKTRQIEQELLGRGAEKKVVGEIIANFLPVDRLPIF